MLKAKGWITCRMNLQELCTSQIITLAGKAFFSLETLYTLACLKRRPSCPNSPRSGCTPQLKKKIILIPSDKIRAEFQGKQCAWRMWAILRLKLLTDTSSAAMEHTLNLTKHRLFKLKYWRSSKGSLLQLRQQTALIWRLIKKPFYCSHHKCSSF